MWHIFRGRIQVVFSPSFTSIPPQIHHQKTTICRHVFAKTPAKTPSQHAVKKLSTKTTAEPKPCRHLSKSGSVARRKDHISIGGAYVRTGLYNRSAKYGVERRSRGRRKSKNQPIHLQNTRLKLQRKGKGWGGLNVEQHHAGGEGIVDDK